MIKCEYSNVRWYNGYTDESVTKGLSSNTGVFIIYGLEQVVKRFINGNEVEHARNEFNTWLNQLIIWESQSIENHLYLIGCDIGKGIVPIEASHREWRDLVGWCYQDIVKNATKVSLIWYGIEQELKNEEEDK
ncbi:bifunctional adenosylcobinamide kinase/adenosylcobinamide-phosphate guanylyltransferase [Alkalihalophilus lindianensis]|uniref:Bifunctional adenosylcobinamide kinase/adenosylcobinamide-phosphate guanylyltransferase n=1 Tax=Alkalihalophilus lindianensis TaxID=1630542 RepID=A0ABU3X676_9BACI|nr:bifunctional adenosylcobinamide kinase/adenosylcobinamide-phosphate guanylyltransferase [Alkalihalophilus lindianensis]MDV2683406.1 bifunctional adenosylcobinamide kinase/adenosylcobinamide-phosphate guanylyltransferase [Alkalihalophilus lindianensis]